MEDVKCIHYTEGYKYQLTEDYKTFIPELKGKNPIDTGFINLTDGELLVRKGYAWDGPSGPTIDTPSFMRGSMVHDALYQLMRLELLSKRHRGLADLILRDMCIEDGMWRIRAWYVYRSVSDWAGFAADPKSKKKVCVAPGRRL